MTVLVVTPPAKEPIPLDGPGGAKEHLRVDGSDEDALISGLIVAAREHCEGVQNRSYVTQTLEIALHAWPAGRNIELPRPPLQQVDSVTYVDADGVQTVWDPANYLVDTRSYVGSLHLARGTSWPSVTLPPINGIVVRYVAGYGDAAKVPQKVKQAMLLLIGHWYEHREAVLTGTISKEIEFAVSALLDPDKVY